MGDWSPFLKPQSDGPVPASVVNCPMALVLWITTILHETPQRGCQDTAPPGPPPTPGTSFLIPSQAPLMQSSFQVSDPGPLLIHGLNCHAQVLL